MTKTKARSKPDRHRLVAWMHDRRAGIDGAVPSSDRGIKINDLGETRIRFRFVLIQKLTRKELWTILRIACGWTRPAVARIPQITSLRPGKL